MLKRLTTLAILMLFSLLAVSCTHRSTMKKDPMHQGSMMEDQGMMQDKGMMQDQGTMKK